MYRNDIVLKLLEKHKERINNALEDCLKDATPEYLAFHDDYFTKINYVSPIQLHVLIDPHPYFNEYAKKNNLVFSEDDKEKLAEMEIHYLPYQLVHRIYPEEVKELDPQAVIPDYLVGEFISCVENSLQDDLDWSNMTNMFMQKLVELSDEYMVDPEYTIEVDEKDINTDLEC